MNYKKLLAVYDRFQIVKGEVNITWSTHQNWSIIILVKYKTKFLAFAFSLLFVHQRIAANWTAPRQDKMPKSPNGIEPTSTRLSQSALLRLTTILLSCY